MPNLRYHPVLALALLISIQAGYAADLCSSRPVDQKLLNHFLSTFEQPREAQGSVAGLISRSVPVAQGRPGIFQGQAVREGVASMFGGPRDRSTGGRAAFTHENLRVIGTGHAPADYFCALRLSNLKLANTPILVIYGNHAIACRLVDKGPYTKGRMIDVSPATMRDVGVPRGEGTPRVKIAFAKPGTPIGVSFLIKP